MKCTNPQTYGFNADGRTLTRSQKECSKEFAAIQLPCGKCISCKLNYAREWAIRSVHEAQLHEKNSFITLTYDNEHLLSETLIYKHFQDFMKRLRFKYCENPIGVIVAGEYGEKTKRPHWHAILFGCRPEDLKPHYKTDRGDQVYTSEKLTELWGHGHAELGSVNINSAGYVARYSAKKIVHGDDQLKYKPIFKASSKYAIGKRWLEKYYEDIFNYGDLIVDGKKVPIPRYYLKWLQKNKPERWLRYVTETKQKRVAFAVAKS